MTATDPFLPLDVVPEHLDALEGLLSRRRTLTFDRRPRSQALAKVEGRIAAHMRALALRPEELRSEAIRRLASPVAHEAFSAAWVLAQLTPDALIDERGSVCLSGRARQAALAALAASPTLAPRLSVDDPALLVTRVIGGAVQEEELAALVRSTEPLVREAALVAAAVVPSRALFSAVAEAALSSPRGDALDETRPSALFALGRLLCGQPNDAGFSGVVELAWEDEVFGSDRALFVAALFGHLPTALRICERIATRGATSALVFALGLVGLQRFVPTILEAAVELPYDALLALHVMTGKLASQSGRDRDDGLGLVFDGELARAISQQTQPSSLQRMHLGQPIARGEAASQLWLARALGGQAIDLPFWLQAAQHPVVPGFFELAPASRPWLA